MMINRYYLFLIITCFNLSNVTFAGDKQIKSNEPILCSASECNLINQNENTDSEEIIYNVIFKSNNPSIKNTDELLNEFNKNYPKGVKTHHFNTKNSEEGITAQISVDGKAGKDAIIEMLAMNRNLILVKVKQTGIKKTNENSPSNLRQKSIDRNKLFFELPDNMGRIIHSQDYLGAPVLIMCGSCWCGGCQQDAEPLRKIAEEYMPKGLAVIRSVSGDNELAALDFAKHYRLGFPQILDTNREFERKYNEDGWTFLMLADRQGKIIYKCNSPEEKDWSSIKILLENMTRRNDANQTTVIEGISYQNNTLLRNDEIKSPKLREEFASIACGKDGRVYVVFTTNKNGNNDVYIRYFDRNTWSQDFAVCKSAADEYDATVIVDNNNQAYVCWTSNAKGEKYNIFITSFTDPAKLNEPIQITDSQDDSMHARMACDDDGRIWITYYKWRKMGQWSRDKEIYVRKYAMGKLSEEIQVSPTDVPEYEDHTEPVITGYGDGAIVCWSWDFHQPPGYTKEAQLPTIFIRKIAGNFSMIKSLTVSGKDTDVTPSIATISGQIWCAWDCMAWNNRLKTYRKNVFVKKMVPEEGKNTQGIFSLCEPSQNICSPVIATDTKGKACVVWSQKTDLNKWILKMSEFEGLNNLWGKSEIIESEGNPRFCSAGYDNYGKLWLAYSVTEEQKRTITVKAINGE